MVTVLWKSRDVCTAAVCSIKRCMVVQYKQHSSFNKSPPLPCVVSKASYSLTSGVTTNSLWLLGLTALTCLVSGNCNYSVSGFSVALLVLYWNPYILHTCLFSGNPCCAVYTCSCPVWGHWACLTSWPPQPSLGQSASHSLVLVL